MNFKAYARDKIIKDAEIMMEARDIQVDKGKHPMEETTQRIVLIGSPLGRPPDPPLGYPMGPTTQTFKPAISICATRVPVKGFSAQTTWISNGST